MALTARDVVLILRAKDEASSVIRGVGSAFGALGTEAHASAARMIAAGSALVTLGAGMSAAGLGLLALTKSMVDASLQYQQQASLTATQTDAGLANLQRLKEIGLDVAKTIPVAFDQIQPTLFDIFSSTDASVEEGATLLELFARAGVAGQADVQDAARGTIAIMNGLGYSIEDANRVVDVQFQLYRKGVGTYEDFSNAIGFVIPAAARAGQSIEDVGGMLAFLTRNGLTAQTASTSAARALESLANPKVVDRLEAMGITVRDAKGQFLPMAVVATQLGQKMKDLTDPERAAALQELFKGAGGTIQARRFWDTAIRNFDQLVGFTQDMENSAGQMDIAYDIMFNQPLSKMQLFQNKLQALKVTFGDILLPVVSKLADQGMRLLDWIDGLSPKTKELIAKGIALAGVLLTIVGALAGISGGFLLFAGAIKMAGGLAAVMSWGLGFLGVLGLIAAAAYLVWKNWDDIQPLWEKYWPRIKEIALGFFNWLRETWATLWPQLRAKLEEFWNWLTTQWQEKWPKIKQFLIDTLEAIRAFWEEYWPKFRQAIEDVWNWIQENWPKIKDTFFQVKDAVVEAINTCIEWAQKFWDKLVEFKDYLEKEFYPGVMKVWESLKENIGPIIEDIRIFIEKAWNTIKTITEAVWPYLKTLIGANLLAAKAFVEGFWTSVTGLFAGGLEMIRGFLDIIAGLMTGDWGRVWDGAKHILHGFWTAVTGIVQGIAHTMQAWFSIAAGFVMAILREFFADFTHFWSVVFTWLSTVPGRIKGAIGDLGGILTSAGRAVIQGLWNGMKDRWEDVAGWLGGLGGRIKGLKGPAEKDAVMLVENGNLIMQGLHVGLAQRWHDIERWLSSLDPAEAFGTPPLGDVPMGPTLSTPTAGIGTGGGTSITIAPGAVQVIIQGDVADQSTVDDIETVVEEKFAELVRQLSQPTYRGTYG